MGRKEEVAQKKGRILAYMKKQGLGAVLFGVDCGLRMVHGRWSEPRLHCV